MREAWFFRFPLALIAAFLCWAHAEAMLLRVRLPSGHLERLNFDSNRTISDLGAELVAIERRAISATINSNNANHGVGASCMALDGCQYNLSAMATNATRLCDIPSIRPGYVVEMRPSVYKNDSSSTSLVSQSALLRSMRGRMTASAWKKQGRQKVGGLPDVVVSRTDGHQKRLYPQDSRPLTPIGAVVVSRSAAAALRHIATRGGLALLLGTRMNSTSSNNSAPVVLNIQAVAELAIFEGTALRCVPLSVVSPWSTISKIGLEVVGIAVSAGLDSDSDSDSGSNRNPNYTGGIGSRTNCMWSSFHLYSALQLWTEMHRSAQHTSSQEKRPLLVLSVAHRPKGSRVTFAATTTTSTFSKERVSRVRPMPLLMDDSLLMEAYQLNGHASALIGANLLSTVPFESSNVSSGSDSRADVSAAAWVAANAYSLLPGLRRLCHPSHRVTLNGEISTQGRAARTLSALVFAFPVPLLNRLPQTLPALSGVATVDFCHIFPSPLSWQHRASGGYDNDAEANKSASNKNKLRYIGYTQRLLAAVESTAQPAELGGAPSPVRGEFVTRLRDLHLLTFLHPLLGDEMFTALCHSLFPVGPTKFLEDIVHLPSELLLSLSLVQQSLRSIAASLEEEENGK